MARGTQLRRRLYRIPEELYLVRTVGVVAARAGEYLPFSLGVFGRFLPRAFHRSFPAEGMSGLAKDPAGMERLFNVAMTIEANIIGAFHEDAGIIRRVGIVTGQAPACLYGRVLPWLRELALVMAVKAEVGNSGDQQLFIIPGMGIVASGAAHPHCSVHDFLREPASVMTSIAELRLFSGQAFGDSVGLLMGDLTGIGDPGMAGRAAPLERGVNDLHLDHEAGMALGAVNLRWSSNSSSCNKKCEAEGLDHYDATCRRRQAYGSHALHP